MRSDIADFILCQETSNPSRELLSESGGYTTGGDGGFHEILRYHGTRERKRKREGGRGRRRISPTAWHDTRTGMARLITNYFPSFKRSRYACESSRLDSVRFMKKQSSSIKKTLLARIPLE